MSILGTIGTIAKIGGTIANVGSGIYNTVQQKKQQDWDKKAQKTTWKREDTAVQRRVNDLKKAGLSPVLAAGSAASTSQPIRPQAPQHKSDLMQDLALMKQMKKQDADISQTEAQADLLRAQERRTQVETDYMENVNPHKVNIKKIESELASQLKPDKIALSTHAVAQASRNVAQTTLQNVNLNIDRQLKEAGLDLKQFQILGEELSNDIKFNQMSLQQQELTKKALVIEYMISDKKKMDNLGLPYKSNLDYVSRVASAVSAKTGITVNDDIWTVIKKLLKME